MTTKQTTKQKKALKRPKKPAPRKASAKALKRPKKPAPWKASAARARLATEKVAEVEFGNLPRSPLWEVVDEGTIDGRTPLIATVRAPAPGGWLVCVTMRGLISNPTYVPDPTASWLRRKAPASVPVPESTVDPVIGLEALAPAAESETAAAADGDVTHGGDPGDEAAA